MDLTELRQAVARETRQLSDPPSVDDIERTVNLVQRAYLQPVAQEEATATYTTTGATEVTMASIAPDFYELKEIYRLTPEGKRLPVSLLDSQDTARRGLRFVDGTLYIQGYDTGTQFELHYFVLLQDLGGTHQTPQIPARWHDLYWLGAAAFLNPANPMLQATWQSRLDAYRVERGRGGRADRRFVRVVYE